MKRIKGFDFLKASAKIAPSELLLTTRFLVVMLKAGDSPEQALKAIAETQGMEQQKDMFLAIRTHILNGETLSSALSEYPDVFPESYRNSVVTFEGTEKLALTLERAANDVEILN